MDRVVTGQVNVTPSFRPGTPSSLADGAFEVFRRAPFSLLAISAAANLPLFGSAAAMAILVRERGMAWGSAGYFLEVAAIAIATALSAWIRAVGTGALAHGTVVALAGGDVSAASSFAAAFRRGASLAVVGALRFLVVLFTLGCGGIPAVFSLGLTALAPHLVVLEDLSVSDAFLRSARLGANAARGLFAATLLAIPLGIVTWAEILLFLQLSVVVGSAVVPGVSIAWVMRPETAWIALALTKVLVDPLVTSATVLGWVDARIRDEGLDLELRSQMLAGEPLTIDPRGAHA